MTRQKMGFVALEVFVLLAIFLSAWIYLDLGRGISGFIRGFSDLWSVSPRFVIGGACILVPLILAYPLHYFLNVRRTSQGGVVLVTGLVDYIGHGFANLMVFVSLNGSILYGIYLLLFG